MPETTDIVRFVELEPTATRIYRDLVQDSYAELGKGEVTVTNILTRLLRLSQLTGRFIGDDEGNAPQRISTAKQAALEDIVEDVLQEGKKLVVIARFVPEIEAIRKLLETKGIRYSLIMGGVKDRDGSPRSRTTRMRRCSWARSPRRAWALRSLPQAPWCSIHSTTP